MSEHTAPQPDGRADAYRRQAQYDGESVAAGPTLQAAVEWALNVSERRRVILSQMKAAVDREDKDAVFALARIITGVSSD